MQQFSGKVTTHMWSRWGVTWWVHYPRQSAATLATCRHPWRLQATCRILCSKWVCRTTSPASPTTTSSLSPPSTKTRWVPQPVTTISKSQVSATAWLSPPSAKTRWMPHLVTAFNKDQVNATSWLTTVSKNQVSASLWLSLLSAKTRWVPHCDCHHLQETRWAHCSLTFTTFNKDRVTTLDR